ncbi:MAG TPA: TolC family protein [Bryobacteraceae bacterium]|nr:TolC family protein [Bryobacteraceae bacterium]
MYTRPYGIFRCAAFVLAARLVFAQLPGQTAPPAGSPQAIQLPLSGRTPQNGSVGTTETPVPGQTTSVNTINTSVQVQGAYQGSIPGKPEGLPGGKLGLRDAIQRGLAYNLGAVGFSTALRQARGQQRIARSSLLPNLNGGLRETVLQEDLRALGVRAAFLPAVVGPFNYFDLRATLTQTVADFTALNNYRSAQESVRATAMAARDARDLIVLAVGGAYLVVIAANARVHSAQAQIETAQALFKQSSEQRQVGVVAQIDVNRTQVELQMQQQRMVSLQNDLAKQKINLARLVGLPPNDSYELADDVPFGPAPDLTFEAGLKQAFENRADLQQSEAALRAAERARAAARAERLPSLAVSADYGAIGTNPAESHGTFTVTGTLRFPIWQGGRIEGDIQDAEAALEQRRAELQDLRGRIEADVRSAFLDLKAAGSQLNVARSNQQLARDTLTLTRQRFEVGISDAVEVTQSQESVAAAELDYITSLFAYNVAKLALARAIGHAEEHVGPFLNLR